MGLPQGYGIRMLMLNSLHDICNATLTAFALCISSRMSWKRREFASLERL